MRERDVRNPIVKTYLRAKRKNGETVVHARVYSPEYDLDRRGTGPSARTAVERAMRGIPRPR